MENLNDNISYVEKMRHSAAHVLAQAVLKLYPGTKLGIGPAIEDGFYYDFELPVPINEEDLPKIEAEMKKIIEADLSIRQEYLPRKEVLEYFKNSDQPYKLDLLKDIKDDPVSLFITGNNDFTDLCRGPHVSSTGEIKNIKLLRIAGAYWRGDETQPMLTRIYGTAFETEEELQNYLQKLENAQKYNHRVLGKQLKIFAIIPEIGKGLPVWLPNGYTIRRLLENYMWEFERSYGYKHILTPHINKEELFKTSGHLEFYKESMYAPMTIDDETYYLKPMNCPAGMMVYKLEPKSYNDLPLKLGEFGTVYRYEKSGELHGLQRVRGFTQNDAHIFCTPEQLEQQFVEVVEMLQKFYKDMGFDNYYYRLSLSKEGDKKFSIKPREDWLHVEDLMRKALKAAKLEFEEVEGEAAFYGPKLDVQAVNVFGKEDTISTIQVDFNLPERFDLEYTDSNGEKKRPFVIHRALVGSFERFFAFLIEYYKGLFPLWLAPEQLRIIPISDKHFDYAEKVAEYYKDQGFRLSIDKHNETLGSRIRKAELEKIPYLLIVGDKEENTNTVSVRPTGKAEIGIIDVEKFANQLQKEIEEKVTRHN